MSYLEQKRNALMNSVASGGAIEYIDTITITEDTAQINIDVDTSKYNTFIIKGTITWNQASNNWLYYGVNNIANLYMGGTIAQNIDIPDTTRFHYPIIVSRTIDGNTAFNIYAVNQNGSKVNTLWENVTQITLGSYASSKYANGTQLSIYGMKDGLIF